VGAARFAAADTPIANTPLAATMIGLPARVPRCARLLVGLRLFQRAFRGSSAAVVMIALSMKAQVFTGRNGCWCGWEVTAVILFASWGS
jgi:hypothetical protein